MQLSLFEVCYTGCFFFLFVVLLDLLEILQFESDFFSDQPISSQGCAQLYEISTKTMTYLREP